MQPFTIAIPDAEIEDLQRRLENVRWPDQAPGDPWTFGIEREVMQYVVDYWRNTYDWRAREARMNAYPNFITTAEGEQVHFLHVRSSHANATPMVLTHGWPGSFVEFLDVIEPLTELPCQSRHRCHCFGNGTTFL
jgi:epoxide hydrolase